MELKQAGELLPVMCKVLLIVPYGIETSMISQVSVLLSLLIVPYGIETSFSRKGSGFKSHF